MFKNLSLSLPIGLAGSAVVVVLAGSAAMAVPAGSAVMAAPLAPPSVGTLPITPIANGCGFGFFRTIAGNCVANRRIAVGPHRDVVLPPPCPRGFRRDPNPARPVCYPLF